VGEREVASAVFSFAPASRAAEVVFRPFLFLRVWMRGQEAPRRPSRGMEEEEVEEEV